VVNVFQEYKSALAHFRRRNFDPFRRRTRIRFQVGEEKHETTVGQLNFILWAFRNGICGYTLRNIDDIESDMNATTKRSRKEKGVGTSMVAVGAKRRRKELSESKPSVCAVFAAPSNVFDE